MKRDHMNFINLNNQLLLTQENVIVVVKKELWISSKMLSIIFNT